MLIAIDHGNKQIKTLHHTPFTSGLIQSDAPGFGNDVLQYQGKYYTLTNQRIPSQNNQTTIKFSMRFLLPLGSLLLTQSRYQRWLFYR